MPRSRDIRLLIRDRSQWFLALGLAVCCMTAPGMLAEQPDPTDRVRQRLELRTPTSDVLLSELEQDFVELLQRSDYAAQLLEAEELLIATNDNSHWTNYSAATRILRRDRDIASIPLLLRYIVLHSRRSACHIMIPEYRKTIETISGHELPDLYSSGPDLEARVREQVAGLVNDWWGKVKENLVVDPAGMSPGQMQVLVEKMLQDVRRHGDFTGSGGKPDSAYGAYHNVYYRVLGGSSSERLQISPIHAAMIPLLLKPCGYRMNQKSYPVATERFPYETIWILSEFVKNGHEEAIQRIADDKQQNSIVQMVGILALLRAGHPFKTDRMIAILDHETDLERRLIALLSLRWGGEPAVAVLLKHMDDPNIEIATAAACALRDAKPRAAIPKFESLLDRHHVSSPLLLYGALAEYQSPESRALFFRLLTDAVERKKNAQHLDRLLTAFADAWNLPRSEYNGSGDRDYERQARLALACSRDMIKQQQAELRRLEAVVNSLEIQLKVAKQIESLRRDEYKRLLLLQGDEIVSAEESQEASSKLQIAVTDVNALRAKLLNQDAALKSLRSKVTILP